MVNIINQIFEIQEKCNANEISLLERNLNRLHNEIENMGYIIINPINTEYKDTAADIEANFAEGAKSNQITKVMKPVIYQETETGGRELIQKGIVIVG